MNNNTLEINGTSVNYTVSSIHENGMFDGFYEFVLYHLVTIGVVFLIIAAIIVKDYGTKRNLKIATSVLDSISPLLHKSFSNYSGQLIQQSPHILKLYASGRQSCIFGIFAFALIPRQQLMSFFFNFLFFNLKDELVIEIPIRSREILPITMAIVRKKNIREITKKKFPDIKQLCKEYKPTDKSANNVPDTHAILVQRKDHVGYLLASQKQVETWTQYGKHVKMVYLSDVNKFSRYPMALRMVLNIGDQDITKNSGQGLIALMEWMIAFMDRMSKVKMPVIDKKEAKKKRQGINIDYQF